MKIIKLLSIALVLTLCASTFGAGFANAAINPLTLQVPAPPPLPPHPHAPKRIVPFAQRQHRRHLRRLHNLLPPPPPLPPHH